MALINCPECGKEVSDKIEFCIHCGFPLRESSECEEEKVQVFLRRGKSFLTKRDYKQAFQNFMCAAEMGDTEAQNYVASFYHDGIGVERNSVLAMEWYEKAAQKNDFNAIGNMAILYHHGLGVAQDYVKARQLYEKALNLGSTNPDVQNNLAALYIDGLGTNKNYARAEVLLKQAMAQGHTNAKSNYALLQQLMAQPTPRENAITWLVILGMWACIIGGVISFFAFTFNDLVGVGLISCILLVLAGFALYYGVMPKSAQEQQKQYEEEKKRKLLTEGYLCPNCGMRAGHEFGKIEKSASIGFWGIHSDKLGKTYQCANCGYKW